MSLELVIFDVDGLLLDTELVWQEVWRETARSFQLPINGDDLFLQVLGRSGPEVEKILQNALQSYVNTANFLAQARMDGTKRLTWDLHLKNGAKELLSYLKEQNIPIAIATSTAREATMQRLHYLNIVDYFSYICCGDEVEERKPSPQIYQKVITDLQIEKQHALVLEDSAIGIEAAYRAGIPCIMVPDIVAPTEEELKRTYRIVEHLGHIKTMLQEHTFQSLFT